MPRFSDQEIEQGLTDFNDQANQSPAEAAAVTGQLTLAVALYLNRRLRSQAIHDLKAVNYCTQIVDYCT